MARFFRKTDADGTKYNSNKVEYNWENQGGGLLLAIESSKKSFSVDEIAF